MKKIFVIGAAALAFAAAPAMANETRVEARGGIVWANGFDEATAGIAAGYDFDLGETAFAGVEVSGDKILTDNTRVSFGFGGRVGAKLGEAGKLYVASSYQTKPCSFCDDSVSVGAGYQHALGEKLYAKVEYRRYIADGTDLNGAVIGIGAKF
jgi:outer membrane immunogenic protein